MKESIATINASENRGSLMANATSRNLINFATSLSASIFLMASSAQANVASIAVIRDVHSGADVVREVGKIEEALKARDNELSYTVKGNRFDVTFR
jgi:hypothetical protein